MNIVIVGAGNTGRYLAMLLSKEHSVTIIDKDKKKLEQLSLTMDIATRLGSGSDWQLLDEMLETGPDLLIALTNLDDTNLVICSLAKQLGYPSTIARVHDNRYLNRTRLDFGRVFAVDHFICPELLAANEILKYVVSEGAIGVEYFAHGAVKLRTFKIPAHWPHGSVPLSRLELPQGIIVGLIFRCNERGESIIFPHGSDQIEPNDEVTFIGEAEVVATLPGFFGIPKKEISSLVIAGGSLTAYHLAKLLQKRHLGIRIFEKDRERAAYLADQLPHTTIIHHDALDLSFLKSEKLEQVDLMVACTQQDEKNLLACLLAQEAGCKDTLMIVSHGDNLPLLRKNNIEHAISPVICAANRILSQMYKGMINTLFSLYDNRVEVVEATVSIDSKVLGIPLSDLGPLLPKDFLIALIQNRGRIFVAHGSRILSPGDTVIVITDPKHVDELEKIF